LILITEQNLFGIDVLATNKYIIIMHHRVHCVKTWCHPQKHTSETYYCLTLDPVTLHTLWKKQRKRPVQLVIT